MSVSGDMTQTYMETNIEPMDNSATPDVGNDGFFVQRPYGQDLSLSQKVTF